MAKSSDVAPIMWSSLSEHVIKTTIYSAFAFHAVQSASNSSTTFSFSINSLIAFVALWLIKSEIETSLKRIQKKLPPGHFGYPIIREIQTLLTLARDGNGMIESFENRRLKYGSFFSSYFFGMTNILMGGEDDLSFVFNSDRKGLTETSWPPTIVMLLGPGAVANQSGPYHRALRRLMEPYFAPKFVNNYLTIINETTVKQLDSWASSGEFLSSEVFKMYALRLFYASSFGRIDEDVLATLHDDYKIWLNGFTSMTAKRLPGTTIDEAMKARDRILNTIDGLIDIFLKENPEESERAQTTVIGRFLYGKDNDNNSMMTRDEVKDNMLNLIFAGHDTTNSSIASLLYHLSQNPDAMESLADEVSALSEPLKSDELKNAPITNACIHESWRLDPPVIGAFRKTVIDKLQHKGYSFDKGTVFNYSVLMATMDESLYKNHKKFNMRRFLPKDHQLYRAEDDSGIDPFQGKSNYPIFGGGTHVCLGKSFAQLEMRVLAARMFQGYKLEVRNPKKVVFPVNGWNIEFKLTKKKNT